MLAGTLGHVLFLFLTASVIAFLLNPLVRDLQRSRLPRGLAVAVVYLIFAAAVTFGIVALGTVVVDQTRSAADRIDAYLTDEPGRTGDSASSRDVDGFRAGCTTTGIDVELSERGRPVARRVDVSELTQDAISFAQGAASRSSSSSSRSS